MGTCGNASLCESWHAYVYGKSTFYPRYQADPDISGTGVIIAFIVSGAMLLCLLSSHIILNIRANAETNLVDYWVYTAIGLLPLGLAIPPQIGQFWDPVIITLILSLSDQMLLTGLSMTIAAYTLHCTMSVFHAGIVLDLAWFASGAHLLTLSHLHRKIQGRDRLRNSRVVLMVIMAALLLINTFFLGHWATFISGPFNAQCLWDDMRQKWNVFGGDPLPVMTTNLILILILYTIAIIQFYPRISAYFEQWLFAEPQRILQAWRLHERSLPQRNKKIRMMIRALILVAEKGHFLCTKSVRTLLASMSVSFVVNLVCFVWGVKNIFVDREAPHRERHRFNGMPMEGDEDRMGFGQIVPILLLISTILTAVEAYEDRKAEWKHQNTSDPAEQVTAGESVSNFHTTDQTTIRAGEGLFQSPVDEIDLGSSYPTRMDTESGRDFQPLRHTPTIFSLQRRTTVAVRNTLETERSGNIVHGFAEH